MKNKLKLLGIIAVIAAIGFSMVGCDNNGDTSVSAFDGRWVSTDDPREVVVISGSSVRMYWDGVFEMQETLSGNTITTTFTDGGETFTYTTRLSVSGNTLTMTTTMDGYTFTETFTRQS